MRAFTVFFAILSCTLLLSCQEQDMPSAFTGRSITYPMIQGAYFDQQTSGEVVVQESADHTIQIKIVMKGTLEGALHPVHLHRGSLLEDETVALYLSPLEDIGQGQSQSITELKAIEGTPVTFDDFLQLDASIKVHFQETGALKNIILGATNIGKNYKANDALRLDQAITTCNNF